MQTTAQTEESTYKTLVLVKQIYQHGVRQHETTHNYAEKIIALISYDLANETALKLAHLELTKKRANLKFPDLVNKVSTDVAAKGLISISGIANISQVHSRRNNAQHEAGFPHDSELNDARTYTRDFLSSLLQIVWQLKFEDLSLISLVRDLEIKSRLFKSVECIERKEYTNACFEAKIAFERLINSTAFAIYGNPPNLIDIQQNDIGMIQTTSILNYLNSLTTVAIHSLLRINLRDFYKFQSLTSGLIVHFFGESDYRGVQEQGDSSEEDARFALQFVTDSVVNVESIIGEIDKPFGIERRF